MKNLYLVSLSCLASLTVSCSDAAKNKEEKAPRPTPYVETVPTIATLASNPEGGLFIGKKPNEIEVSSTVIANPNATMKIDLKTNSIAGVSLSNSMQEIINTLGTARMVRSGTSSFYIYDSIGLVVGLADSAEGLNAKPTFMYTNTSFGYKGAFKAPESLGEVRIGKKAMNGELTTAVARENFARALGRDLQDPASARADYDCFQEGTCGVGNMAEGKFAVYTANALITMTADGTIDYLELDQAPRTVAKGRAPSETIHYARSIAGLSMNSSAKEFIAAVGAPKTSTNIVTYLNDTIMSQRDANGKLGLFGVQDTFTATLLAADGTVSPIQFKQAIAAEFTCESLKPIVFAAFDPGSDLADTECSLEEGRVSIFMPGADLSFAKEIDAANPQGVVLLKNFFLKNRASVYGEHIAGLKLGFDYNQAFKLYGPHLSAVQNGNSYTVTYVKGLVVTLDFSTAKDGAITSIKADSNYPTTLVNAGKTSIIGKVGSKVAELSFIGEQATSDSFRSLANILENDFKRSRPVAAPAAPADDSQPAVAIEATAATEFDAAKECSFARIKTPACYFEAQGTTGAMKYTVKLPHMDLEFDQSNTLTSVGM